LDSITTPFPNAETALQQAFAPSYSPKSSEEKFSALASALPSAAAFTGELVQVTVPHITNSHLIFDRFFQYLQHYCLKTALNNIKPCASTQVFNSAKSYINLDDLPLDVIYDNCHADTVTCMKDDTLLFDQAKDLFLKRQEARRKEQVSIDELLGINTKSIVKEEESHDNAAGYFYAYLLAEIAQAKNIYYTNNEQTTPHLHGKGLEALSQDMRKKLEEQSRSLLERKKETLSFRRNARANMNEGLLGPSVPVLSQTTSGNLRLLATPTPTAVVDSTSTTSSSHAPNNNNKSSEQTTTNNNSSDDNDDGTRNFITSHKCPHCSKTCPTAQGLKTHITRKHKPKANVTSNNIKSEIIDSTDKDNISSNNVSNNNNNNSSSTESSAERKEKKQDDSDSDIELLLSAFNYPESTEENNNNQLDIHATSSTSNNEDQHTHSAPTILLDDDDDEHVDDDSNATTTTTTTSNNLTLPSQDLGTKETIPHVFLECPSLEHLRQKYGIAGTLSQKQKSLNRLLYTARGYEYYVEILSIIGESPLIISSLQNSSMTEGDDEATRAPEANNNDSYLEHRKKTSNHNVSTKVIDDKDADENNDERSNTDDQSRRLVIRDELSRRKIIRDHSRMNTVMDPCGGDRRREREEEGESEIVLDGVLGLSAECQDNNSVLFPSSNDST